MHGQSAGRTSEGRQEDLEAACGEPGVVEEVGADSEPVGLKTVASEQPPEEEAEIEQWQLGWSFELKM